MRIALIADPGSPHTHVWVNAFVERGHEVHLFSPHKHMPPGDLPAIVCAPLASRRTTSPRGHGRRHAGGDPRKLRTVTRAIRLTPAVRRWVAAIHPDRLIALRLQPEGYLARASGFSPYGIMSWGQDVLRFAQGQAPHRWLARPVLHGAALLIGETDDVVSTMRRLGGRPDRVLKGMAGIDTEFWRPPSTAEQVTARAELLASHPVWSPWLTASAAGERVILSPRAVDRHGHQRELIEACAMCKAGHRSPAPADADETRPGWVLLQAGAGDAQERAACRKLAEESGLSEAYFDIGLLSREDLRRVYWLGHIVVSLWSPDGLSQTLLESMACGLMPIVADIPGNVEWARASESVSFVDPGSPESIAGALSTALNGIFRPGQARPDNRGRSERLFGRKTNMGRLITAVLAMDRADPLGFLRARE